MRSEYNRIAIEAKYKCIRHINAWCESSGSFGSRDYDNIFISIFFELTDPFFDFLERFYGCDLINYNGTECISIVYRNNCIVFFLSGCVLNSWEKVPKLREWLYFWGLGQHQFKDNMHRWWRVNQDRRFLLQIGLLLRFYQLFLKLIFEVYILQLRLVCIRDVFTLL